MPLLDAQQLRFNDSPRYNNTHHTHHHRSPRPLPLRPHRFALPRHALRRTTTTARISQRYRRWRAITADPEILALVRSGLQFVFRDDQPPTVRRRSPVFKGSAAQMRSLALQLRKWLDDGVIQPSTDPSDLLGLLFPVPKPHSSELRWVLDSRFLNDHLLRTKFRLEGIADLRQLVQRGDWLASIDLQSAFLQVPVHPQHQRWLAFEALGRRWRFARMSFGTTVAPYTFTALMKPVLAELRRRGFRVSCYLDDMLLCGSSFQETCEAVAAARALLESLGLPVNHDKSVLVPTQRLEHLGLVFDTTRFTLSVPRRKLKAIAKDARRLLRLDSESGVTARQLAGLAGKITAAAPAMRHAADLHRHAIQRCQHYALRVHANDWDKPVRLSRTALVDIKWWASYAPLAFNGAALRLPEPDATLTTDASPTGFGAVLTYKDGRQLVTHGFWRRDEAARSSNWREMTGVTRGFFTFASRLRRLRTLRIESDNSTAVSILRRFGSRHRHLGLAAEPLLRAVLRWGLQIQPVHLPGIENELADRLSRIDPQRNDYSVSWPAFHSIVMAFGRPSIDWFATAANKRLRRYCARRQDHKATFVDAFSVPWRDEFGLFHPPINLLSKVIARIADQNAHGIVIAPRWPSRPWFGLLMQLARAAPLQLGEDALVPAPFARHPLRDQRSPPLIAVLV